MHLSVEGLRPWDWSYPVLQYLREWPTPTVVSSYDGYCRKTPTTNNQGRGWGLQKAHNARSIKICQKKIVLEILFAWLILLISSMFYVLLCQFEDTE